MTTADGRTDRTIDEAKWLTAGPVAALLNVLGKDGEEARAVGGAVRNTLLREPIGEIDIATTATPEEVTRRVEHAGLKAVPTGIEHGTVTVVIDSKPFEVTTLRQDVETYGRHAKVSFGRDWRADAERRDFTMNALSADRGGQVYDYVGGIADLDARRVRFIGEPRTRIAEDYLRILRFFRFHAAYGRGEPDRAALAACIAGRAGLEQLSRERVRMELVKLLIAPGAAAALAAMMDCGLLVAVLAGVPNVAHVDRMARIERALGIHADAVRRLAALAVLVGEDADRLWQRLRLSNAEHHRLSSMGDSWWRISPRLNEVEARALLYRAGAETFADRGLLAFARSGAAADDKSWQTLVSLPKRWRAPEFPLKAADFISRGVPKGPRLGAALATAERAWIAADFPSDDAAIKRIADAALSDAGH